MPKRLLPALVLVLARVLLLLLLLLLMMLLLLLLMMMLMLLLLLMMLLLLLLLLLVLLLLLLLLTCCLSCTMPPTSTTLMHTRAAAAKQAPAVNVIALRDTTRAAQIDTHNRRSTSGNACAAARTHSTTGSSHEARDRVIPAFQTACSCIRSR
jgi:hypothetical protein